MTNSFANNQGGNELITKTRKKLSAILLGAILALGVGAGLGLSNVQPVKAAEETITLNNIGTDVDTTANTTIKKVTVSGYELNYYQARKTSNGANIAMLLEKGKSPFVGNKTPIPGHIKSIDVKTLQGASGSTNYHVHFSSTEFAAPGSGGTAINIGSNATKTFTNTNTSGDTYFAISLGNNNHGQVQNIIIKYETAPAKALTSIAVTTQPGKTSYYAGDTFDGIGMVVKAYFDDGSNEVITPVLPTGALTAGQTSVEISYTFGGTKKTTTVAITVLENPVTQLVWANPVTSFYEGDVLSLGAGTITATYENANTALLTLSDVNIFVYSGDFDPATAVQITPATPLTIADHNGKNIKFGFESIYSNAAVLAISTAPFVPTTTYGGVGTTATLVTNDSALSVGDKIIIAAKDTAYSVALGEASGNFRISVDVTISGNKITDLGSATILTLGGSSAGWTLSSGTEYLYYSGESNHLYTGNSSSEGKTWTISIESGVAIIANVAKDTRELQYNAGSPRFACYTGSQVDPIVYKMDSSAGGEFNYDYLLDILKGGYCDLDLAGLNTLVERYEAMTSIEKFNFNSATILGLNGETYTGEQALNIAMIKRASLGGLTNKNPFNDTFEQNEIVMVIVIISLIGVSAIAGSLFIFKKKNGKGIKK